MSTKWAQVDDPDIPARKFARIVLAERLEVVESRLPRAAHHASDDIEHVHQLRVACRRAAAALRAFAPLMKKNPKKLKKWLQTIRDAAGPARDIDVLVARFERDKADSVSEYALKRLQRERLTAQKSVVKVARQAQKGKLDTSISETFKLLDGAAGRKVKLAKYGRHAVRLAYLPFARLASLENLTTAELHQLRIAGKRLRYSLEIFRGLDPALIDQVYPMVEGLQGRLGELNDHATAQALFQTWLAELPAEALAVDLATRVIEEHRKLIRLKGQFTRWWNIKRVAKVQELVTAFCS